MSLEDDKAELLHILKFIETKEIEITAYQNLFGPLNREYPEEKLVGKFRQLCAPPMGTAVREKYAGLESRVQAAKDPTALLAVLMEWIRSRRS